jgi:hypothetical protein
VRLALVPAVMAIAGPRIWYHPRWFARYVPDPDIDGERLEAKLTRSIAHDEANEWRSFRNVHSFPARGLGDAADVGGQQRHADAGIGVQGAE